MRSKALLQAAMATPDDLRKRFDTFMNERCIGKDATKLALRDRVTR